jgi:hypothetical protein
MDVLANFIDDACIVADGARETASKLWGHVQPLVPGHGRTRW